jgi:hypothetical protein
MRKILVVCALLSLGGCAQLSGAFDSVFGQGASAALVAKVQAGTTALCSFAPTAQSVADILATYAGLTTLDNAVDGAIQGICSAVVTKAGARRKLGTAVFRGVAIHGRYLQ